jgi:uncharacterized protein (DUF427 family)
MQHSTKDHPITIEPTRQRVVVRAGGRVVADSTSALTLREASYPPVQYIPRDDVDMTALSASSHKTTCPYKGIASYFSIGDGVGANAVWSYEEPYSSVSEIAGHLAFYPNRVDAIEFSPRE